VALRPAPHSAFSRTLSAAAGGAGGNRKERVESAVAQILEALDASPVDPKTVPLGLKSPAADITKFFYGLSKNDFKGGVWALFSGGFVRPFDSHMTLVTAPAAGTGTGTIPAAVAEVMAADNHAWHQKQRAKREQEDAVDALERQRQAEQRGATRAALPEPTPEAVESQRHRGERLRKKQEALALGLPVKRKGRYGREAEAGVLGAVAGDRTQQSQQSQQGVPTVTLFLGNLSYECEEEHIRDFLGKGVGAAAMVGARIRVGRDRSSGDHRGFAHAEFPLAQEGAAKRVWQELHGQKLLGRPVIVDTV